MERQNNEPGVEYVHQTKYGRVQGFVARVGRDAEQQRHVEVFLGLPYASPPVGEYR